MTPETPYIDVGMVYLVLLGLSATAIFVVGNLARRWRTAGLKGLWDSARYGLAGLALTIGVSGACITVVLGVAYGLGWLVHLLKWWPY